MLATKLPTWLVKTPEDVERLFNEQCESCGVDYFDVYHMHALEKDRWATMKAVKGHALIEAGSQQAVTAEPQVHYQGNSCEICGSSGGTSTGFSWSSSDFYQYYSTSDPYSFSHR
jgi:hypothetical protein